MKPNFLETRRRVDIFRLHAHTQKNEGADASLSKIFPASRLYFDTTNQTKTVDGGRASSKIGVFQTLREEPTPFRCPGPHSPSKVEGVAGTYSMGRSLWLPYDQDALRFSFSCIQFSSFLSSSPI